LEDKIFITSQGQIQRFDVEFYNSNFSDINNKISSSWYEIKKLSDIFEISRWASPRPISKFITEDTDWVNWIKIGDTKNTEKYIYKTKERITKEWAKKSRYVKEWDFILSNSMSFGKPYIMKIDWYIHDGWQLLRPKEEELNIDFLYNLLNADFVFQLFKQSTIWWVVENLNIDIVRNLRIPFPPTPVQNEVVQKMDTALAEKKKKESEAKELFNSIDGYVLWELGIKYEEVEEKKFFGISASDIDPANLSADFYSTDIWDVWIKTEKLSELAYINPKISAIEQEEDIPFIWLPNTSNWKIREIELRSKKDISWSRIAEENDILFARIEPSIFNKKYIFIDDLEWYSKSYVSWEFLVIRSKWEVNQRYLYYILFRDIVFKQFSGKTTWSTWRRRLANSILENIKIPVPSSNTQEKIANEVKSRIEKAEKLESEAKEVYENAKREVESMILGE